MTDENQTFATSPLEDFAARTVACPKCGAPVGAECAIPEGYHCAAGYHLERYEASKAACIKKAVRSDAINSPAHYTSHPSGIECIQITEHFGFNIGNAIKYLWRAGLKTSDPIEDLEKAAWYVAREIAKRKRFVPTVAP